MLDSSLHILTHLIHTKTCYCYSINTDGVPSCVPDPENPARSKRKILTFMDSMF